MLPQRESGGDGGGEIKREKKESDEVETHVNFSREKVGEMEAEVRREEEEREETQVTLERETGVRDYARERRERRIGQGTLRDCEVF